MKKIDLGRAQEELKKRQELRKMKLSPKAHLKQEKEFKRADLVLKQEAVVKSNQSILPQATRERCIHKSCAFPAVAGNYCRQHFIDSVAVLSLVGSASKVVEGESLFGFDSV